MSDIICLILIHIASKVNKQDYNMIFLFELLVILYTYDIIRVQDTTFNEVLESDQHRLTNI